MRILIHKYKKGDTRRNITYEMSNDDYPEIYVEVSPNDYEDVKAIPLQTLINLWEIVVRKKSIDKYLEDYDLMEE